MIFVKILPTTSCLGVLRMYSFSSTQKSNYLCKSCIGVCVFVCVCLRVNICLDLNMLQVAVNCKYLLFFCVAFKLCKANTKSVHVCTKFTSTNIQIYILNSKILCRTAITITTTTMITPNI